MDPLAHIPGNAGLPVLGHSVQFVRDCRGLLEARRERYGDVFKSNGLGGTTVTFLTPQATKEIFLDPGRVLSSAGGWSTSIGRLFTRGLLLRDFEDHRVHRRALQQAFTRAALTGYVEQVTEVTDRHLDALPRGEFDVYLLMKRLTLDIAAEVFVGTALGARREAVNRAFAAAVKATITPLRIAMPGSTFRRGLEGRRMLQRIFGDLVQVTRADPPGDTLLSRLAHARTESGELLGVDEVIDQIIFLMLAAHDTTTSTLAVMLWQLALHPDWQHRVIDEVRALDGAPVTLDNHASLHATSLVMDEALRLSPPVPFSPRLALQDLEIDGVSIPAGTGVATASMTLHRHPAWWSDPDRFDPDRFGAARAEHAQHTHLFVPFGGGAHLCLGNHLAELIIKTVTARLLARRTLTADPDAKVVLQPVPIPKPRGPLLLSAS